MESDDNRWEENSPNPGVSEFYIEKYGLDREDNQSSSKLEEGVGCLELVGISCGFLSSAGYFIYRLTQ